MANDYDVLLLGGYFCDLIFTGLPGLPQLGAEVYGSGFEVVPGAAFTTALALHRLGLRVGWSCDFGDDFFSRYVLDEARAAGLDDRLFRLHPHPLRRVTAALSFPHDRAFVSYHDPFERPAAAPLIERHCPRWVLLTGLAYGPAHADLVAAARRVGALVYMDCQCVSATLATPGVAEALRAVDVFAPNEREALALTGADSWEAALERLAALAPLVVLKRGAAAGDRPGRARPGRAGGGAGPARGGAGHHWRGRLLQRRLSVRPPARPTLGGEFALRQYLRRPVHHSVRRPGCAHGGAG